MNKERLNGLDIARAFAFMAMVLVNFKVVMGADTGDDPLTYILSLIEGRAAAAFVILAGIGLGFSATREGVGDTFQSTLKKSIFLLVIGLANMLIFDADILHYYAFYFFFAAFLLRFNSETLVIAIVLLNVAFLLMILGLDYEKGWDFVDLSYRDFWSPIGFIRNLFFNGWHPVFPWLSFVLLGVILSRLSLRKRSTQQRLVIVGSLVVVLFETISAYFKTVLVLVDPELVDLVTTSPIPPMPFYMISACASACILLGVSLLVQRQVAQSKYARILIPMGQQSLTLYILHIIAGMGVLEALGWIGGQSVATAVFYTGTFLCVSLIYVYVWNRFFSLGPIEWVVKSLR